MSKNNASLPQDVNGNRFFSATKVGTPIEVTLNTSTFVAVTLASAVKAVHVSTRDGNDYLLSDVSAGTTYATMKSGVYMDIHGESGDIIFYVKGSTVTTLEILPFD